MYIVARYFPGWEKKVFTIALKATVPVFCGFSVLKHFGTSRWHGSCTWPCKQASRNQAGNFYMNNELTCPRTCMCSPLLFLQTSGCFSLFLTYEGCRLGALGWNCVEFRCSEPQITLLAPIAATADAWSTFSDSSCIWVFISGGPATTTVWQS